MREAGEPAGAVPARRHLKSGGNTASLVVTVYTMSLLPCDICGKSGHPWFECPLRGTKPEGWKPARLMPAARGSDLMQQGIKKSTASRKDAIEETRLGNPQGSSVGIATQRPKGLRTGRATSRSEEEAPKAGTRVRPVDMKDRKADRHRPGYHAEFMRRKRAADKAAKLEAEGK